MAGSNAYAAKKALIDLLTASASLTGVQVAYSLPRDLERECIYGGRISGPAELAAFAAGSRMMRTENLVLDLHTRVYIPGDSDTAAAEARAVALGTVVEELVATNPTLDSLANLKVARLVALEMESGVDDDGAVAELTHQIEFVSQPR